MKSKIIDFIMLVSLPFFCFGFGTFILTIAAIGGTYNFLFYEMDKEYPFVIVSCLMSWIIPVFLHFGIDTP